MRSPIVWAPLLILFFISGLATAQIKDFTAEVKHALAPAETREDAHVLAISEARFKVVDLILSYLKSDENLGAKGLTSEEQKNIAYALISSRNVQEQWNGDNLLKVTFKAGVRADRINGFIKEIMPGTSQLKGMKKILDNYKSLNDSLQTTLVEIAKATAQQKTGLAKQRQNLLDEYAVMDVYEEAKCSDRAKVINVYSQALQQWPDSKAFLCGRGYAYTNNKQYDLALKDFTKALELDPNNIGAYLGRASTYNSVSLEEKALADYNRVIQLDPQNTRAYLSRALIHKKQDKTDLALADYLKAIELEPMDRYSLNAVGYIYFNKMNNLDKALEYFNREIEVAPDQQGGYTSRGYVYMRQQKFDAAITDFSKALEVDPEFGHGLNYMNRGNAYLQKGENEKAKTDLEKAVQLGETRAQTLLRQLPLTK